MEILRNNYNKLSNFYIKSHNKPDKKYSILPTLLNLSRPLDNKTLVDVGCGDGFFSKEFSKEAKEVIGIDSSKEQIKKAKNNASKNILFLQEDMVTFNYPKTDLIISPFVIGYLKNKVDLEKLFTKFFNSLNPSGKLIGLIDFPKSNFHDNKKFGAIKKSKDLIMREGSKILIELYCNNKKIVELNAIYHEKETIESCLKKAGFKKIRWENPIISNEGLNLFGKDFWKEYLENIDIAYFIAEK